MAVIKAVLLDAGGVLFNNVTEESAFFPLLARRHGASEARMREYVDRHDAEYETDTRHVHDVLADALVAAGALPDVPIDRAWIDRLYLSSAIRYEDAFAEVERLRRVAPAVTVALANNEAAHWDHLKDGRHGHLRLFDVVASSWRVGAVKPTAEYFDRVLTACGCVASEALFLDDNPTVVQAAQRLGIRATWLSGPCALGPALRDVPALATTGADRHDREEV
ncbi:HAD family hydrolase [Micromonospora sp. DT46]|uniref:HAD family hydrolase n=1 Tax=Micromonospora sp. DT46 TaxID=3393435 RepID=UPI003CF42C90